MPYWDESKSALNIILRYHSEILPGRKPSWPDYSYILPLPYRVLPRTLQRSHHLSRGTPLCIRVATGVKDSRASPCRHTPDNAFHCITPANHCQGSLTSSLHAPEAILHAIMLKFLCIQSEGSLHTVSQAAQGHGAGQSPESGAGSPSFAAWHASWTGQATCPPPYRPQSTRAARPLTPSSACWGSPPATSVSSPCPCTTNQGRLV